LILLSGALACSDGDEKPKQEASCHEDPTVCEAGTVCEQLGTDAYMCIEPVLVRGRVYEAGSELAVAEASIVALDANGAARSRVARSLADGSYELPVSVPRDANGAPLSEKITLRVGAADYQTFPTPPRAALAIDLTEAQASSVGDAGSSAADAGAAAAQRWVVQNAATEVALIGLPEAQRGGATVAGRVDALEPGGVLVLALRDDKAASSAISDSDGSFVLFNVPTGAVRFEGYRADLSVTPQASSVDAAGHSDLVLSGSAATGSVSGNISIVNADGALTTSVILVVASTFDAKAARGESPAGLRVGDVSGAFQIEKVPAGRYAVLAAFENDRLVRDPDESISGTDVVFVDVAAGQQVSLDQGFKVTEALPIQVPGAEGVEQMSAGMLRLSWGDDSSEDGYELRVYDALGNLVHENLGVPRVSGGASVSYTLDATAYKPGMFYQLRVKSWRDSKGKRSYISASEDLRGVFEIMP
jgi:hypothetical protein